MTRKGFPRREFIRRAGATTTMALVIATDAKVNAQEGEFGDPTDPNLQDYGYSESP